MAIDTIISLATACLKALELVARLERQSREVKAKCQELAERVKILQEILPRYSSADSGTAAMLGRLKKALTDAYRDIESCDRHVQSGSFGALFSAISNFNREDLARLKAAEEKINTCISDLGFAVRSPAAPLVVRPLQRTTTTMTTTAAIQNHCNNNNTTNIFFGDVYVAVQQPPGAASSSSSSRRTHPQMLVQVQQLGSSPGPPVFSGLPSSSHHQRRPTAPTTTTRITHPTAASASSSSSSSAAAAAAASRSRPMTDHRGAPGPATRTTNAPAPPVPPPQPVVRRSSTSSSRARRPPTEPRGVPRGLGGSGLPQQHATAARPARSTTDMPRH